MLRTDVPSFEKDSGGPIQLLLPGRLDGKIPASPTEAHLLDRQSTVEPSCGASSTTFGQPISRGWLELYGMRKQQFPDSIGHAWRCWLEHNEVERFEDACADALTQIQKASAHSAHKRLSLNQGLDQLEDIQPQQRKWIQQAIAHKCKMLRRSCWERAERVTKVWLNKLWTLELWSGRSTKYGRQKMAGSGTRGSSFSERGRELAVEDHAPQSWAQGGQRRLPMVSTERHAGATDLLYACLMNTEPKRRGNSY